VKFKSFLYGALFGIIVGSSTALLTSPKSGKEWRDLMLNLGGDTTKINKKLLTKKKNPSIQLKNELKKIEIAINELENHFIESR
jgi:gas vesicle protein